MCDDDPLVEEPMDYSPIVPRDALVVPYSDVRELFADGGEERLELLTPWGTVSITPAEGPGA